MKFSPGTMRSARLLATTAAASILIGGAVPVLAQQAVDVRLNKVEAEVRALQRKVFPGPDGKFFEPEIAPATSVTAAPAQPVSTPVTDMLKRMDSLESQMARLTSQVEQNTNRISLIEAKVGIAPQTAAAPVTTMPPAAAPSAAAPVLSAPAAAPVAATPKPVPAATAPATPPAAKPVAPSATRVEAVKAIARPQSDDPGDDEYSYGYRLWEAKFYPEAQQQLKLFLEKYPRHRRASWGRNLLGRAYLDDSNPSEAAKWFLQNYQADKLGDRAPDSLLYLGVTMKQMKDSKRACIALAEFSQTYAAEAAGRLKGLYDSTRNGLTCG